MDTRKFLLLSALYLSAGSLATPALASEKDQDEQKHGKPAASSEKHGKQAKPLPPGLQKKVERGGELPPGWKKKLAKGEVLPEEVYKAGKPVSPELKKKLPAEKKGEITVEVDGEIVRVLEKSRKIVEVLSDLRR